jgi:hypothetical protein
VAELMTNLLTGRAVESRLEDFRKGRSGSHSIGSEPSAQQRRRRMGDGHASRHAPTRPNGWAIAAQRAGNGELFAEFRSQRRVGWDAVI